MQIMSVWEKSIMSYELNSYINGAITKLYFQNPLMNAEGMTTITHNHKYTEFHIVFGGNIKMFIDNKKYTFSSGTVYSIPEEVYHCCVEAEPQTQIVAFQADIGLNVFEQYVIDQTIIKKIVDILSKESFYSSCSALSALLSFAVSDFFQSEHMQCSKDYAIAIYDFISRNYSYSMSVSELAKKLHLSDKQTERLTKKYTGYTFKKAMIHYRIKVANFLEKNTDMSKSEISNYVGYSNYSGYWKAKNSMNEPSGK